MNLNIEKIDYVKVTYEDRWDTKHLIKMTVKNITDVDIVTCAKLEGKEYIKEPQDIDLSIITDDGIYRTEAELKYSKYDVPYIFFYIRIKNDLEFQQSREYFRIKYSDGAIIKYDDQKIVCKTVDISAKGVKLELPKRYDIPKDVVLRLLIGNKEFNIQSELIRNSVEKETPLASFMFKNITESEVDYISKFCIQTQLKEKGNKL